MKKIYNTQMKIPLFIILCVLSKVNSQIVEPYTDEKCERTGCNGEICALKNEQEMNDSTYISSCVWKDVYFCYQNAECWYDETQKTCYWSYDKFLKNCLMDYPDDTYENCVTF